MGKKLYVGNLNFNTTDQELEGIFSEYGEIISVSVIKDRDTNRSKGFGFVEFATEASSKKAKEAVDGKEFDGRSLRVDDAKEPRERKERFSGYSSNRRSRF